MSVPPPNVHHARQQARLEARREHNERMPQGQNAARRLQFDELPLQVQQVNIQNAGQRAQRGNNERVPLQLDGLAQQVQELNIQNAWWNDARLRPDGGRPAIVLAPQAQVPNARDDMDNARNPLADLDADDVLNRGLFSIG
jgi:hypothetical protein